MTLKSLELNCNEQEIRSQLVFGICVDLISYTLVNTNIAMTNKK